MSRPDPIVEDPEQVVVRDKRRLDPQSGAVREPAAQAGASAGAATATAAASTIGAPRGDVLTGDAGSGAAVAGDPSAVQDGTASPVSDPVAELTADLQRLSAEYANYRKRVERDRVAVVEMATAGLLAGMLPILDDIDRAREHDDVTGAFKGVADAVEALTGKLGLERYGEVGEPFDPAVHEALLTAEPDPESSVPVCAAVLQPGYRLTGGRVLRAARVSVAEGTAAATEQSPEPR